MVGLRWEKLFNIADDAVDISHHIFREKNAFDGICFDAFLQSRDAHRPIQAENTAYTIEREAKTQLNGRKFSSNKNEHREPLTTIGHFGINQTNSFDGEHFIEI